MGQSGQEKTEQPTAKKRRDARKEGNIFQSRDVATVVILAGIFFGIRIWLPFIYGQMKNYMTWVIDGAAGPQKICFQPALFLLHCLCF